MSPNDGVVSMIGEEWDAARVSPIRCVFHSEGGNPSVQLWTYVDKGRAPLILTG